MSDARILTMIERAKSPHVIALLQLLHDQGWTFDVEVSNFHSASFAHPRSGEEAPTPEYVPDAWWGSPTFNRLRKLRVVGDGKRFTLMTRWTGVPWAQVDQGTLTTYKAAMAYVGEEWPD